MFGPDVSHAWLDANGLQVCFCGNVLDCAAVCCSVFQCVAVCCSVLKCVAVCCSVLHAWLDANMLQVDLRCSVSHACCSVL